MLVPGTTRKRAIAGVALVLAACVSLVGAAPATQPAKGEALVRLNNLGIAYLAQYKAAEAEKQFREALALDPNYIPGRVNLGIAALAQVRYDEAIASFTKALAADPNNIHAHFNLSLIYKIQGKPAEALVAGLKALELDQRDPDIQYQVGSLYMATRDYDKAIQSFEAALRLDPNFLSAYYSMGRAYISKGDLDKGKKLIERHRELQAGTSATPAVGLRYGEQGKYSFAMEDGSTGGPAKALAEGALVFADVSATSGIAFVHGATVQMAALLKSGAGPAAASLGGEEALRSQIAPTMGSGLAVGDVNGDGLEDVFLANAGGAAPESAIYMNKGGMKFERAGGALAPALTTAAMSAAFGDLDGDSDPDLVVALLDRLVIFVNDGAGSFKDATASSGLAGPAKTGILGGLSLADVDHDGDLDIFAAGFLAPVAASNPAPKFPASWGGARSLLYINATVTGTPGAGPKFTETAASAGLDRSGRRTTGAVFGDFDNDRDIDAVVASPGDGSSLFSNQRDGTFKDLGASSGLPANAMILGLTAGDYDKDGRMDLAATTWDGGLPRLFKNVLADPGIAAGHGGGAFALDVSAMADVSRQIGTPQFGVAFTDVDNDGYLDLISVNGADVGPAIFVFRNGGDGRFADIGSIVFPNVVPARNGRGLAVGDFDADGDLDLIISNAGGRPTVLRNDGGNKNHWVRVVPKGLHSNKPGIGTKVEVKSGSLWQKQEVTGGSGYLSFSSVIPHFGLGERTRVDTVRLLWPGGVLQDELQVKADAALAVSELDRKGSSCPILYAWNGKEIGFVSDFLGGSAIGYRTGAVGFNTPDTDEYVKVRADQLRPRGETLDLRLVNQLEETIYFDRARLLAVDHDAAYEIFPDERLMPGPPYPDFNLFAVGRSRQPEAAWDGEGRDLRSALAEVDRIYAGPATLLPFKGYAQEHALLLDLGDAPAGAPLVLLMHGWIDYADSTSNLAASQAGMGLVPPYLEALDEGATGDDLAHVAAPGGPKLTGRWVKVLPRMGFPAGLPKTMTVDLTGKLPASAHIIRIVTSMRIYWDRIRVTNDLGPASIVTPLEAGKAELRYRGFPALVTPDGNPPESYDYSGDQPVVQWKSHTGAFTRFGDVRELLADVDDRYVVTRPGDEIALEFPAAALPPLAPGMTRDYLLFADGFGKDMDVNSSRPDAITPLPFHGMASYPPAPKAGYPYARDGLMEYLDLYNTRLVRESIFPLTTP